MENFERMVSAREKYILSIVSKIENNADITESEFNALSDTIKAVQADNIASMITPLMEQMQERNKFEEYCNSLA